MAALITWLAKGGARKSDGTPVASGSAYFYQPGTTNTQVGIYSDADETAGMSQPVALNAAGCARVFVSVPCRVLIQDSTGADVGSYDSDDRDNVVTAAQVDVENAGFIGTNPVTMVSELGGRVDLDTVLSRAYESFGSTDWNVTLPGSTTSQHLHDALNSLKTIVTPFFNVKDPLYGATGDGSTDDYPAFVAAYNAAVAAGGGIVFVPGSTSTYRIATGLQWTSPLVSLLGTGPTASVLKFTNSSGVSFTLNTTTTGTFSGQRISGIGITNAAAVNTTALQISTTDRVLIENVKIANYYNTTAAAGIVNIQSPVTMVNCEVIADSGGNSNCVYLTSGGGPSVFIGGNYKCYGSGVCFRCVAPNVSWSGVTMTSNTPSGTSTAFGIYIDNATGKKCSAVGCHFICTNTATSTGQPAIQVLADVPFYEDGNSFTGATSDLPATGGGVNQLEVGAVSYTSRIHRGSKRELYKLQTATSGNYDMDCHYGCYHITANGNIVLRAAGTTTHTRGDKVTVFVLNSTGGNITVTGGSAGSGAPTVSGLNGTNVATGASRRFEMVYHPSIGANGTYLVYGLTDA